MFHNDEWREEPADPFTRKVDPNKIVSQYDFDAVQNPEFLTSTHVYKPLKKNTHEKVK